ncbi:MAG: integrase, partial [Proteobacteria bacterium]|nr:integrase [Pseudomonadota bacterium]
RFHRPYRIKLGEFGLISIDQAKHQHRANRVLASQGHDPRQPKTRPMLFRELFFDHYIVQCRSRQKKTIKTDLSRHDNWIGPALDDLAITEINKSHIHQLVVKMIDAGLAPATIRTIVGQIRTILELAVDLGLIDRNPTKGVRTPRVNNRRDKCLTVDQIRAFFTAALNDQNVIGSHKLMLAALTGARDSEITHYCRWDLVDLDAGIWFLPDQKSGRPGKNYLSTASKDVIQRMEAFRCNDYVFPGQRGNVRSGRAIRVFRRLCKQAGIPEGYRPHDLRHGWISAGVNAGVPIEIMSQGARHSSVNVTRIYSHAQPENLVAANELIANLFMPPKAA